MKDLGAADSILNIKLLRGDDGEITWLQSRYEDGWIGLDAAARVVRHRPTTGMASAVPQHGVPQGRHGNRRMGQWHRLRRHDGPVHRHGSGARRIQASNDQAQIQTVLTPT